MPGNAALTAHNVAAHEALLRFGIFVEIVDLDAGGGVAIMLRLLTMGARPNFSFARA